MTEIKQLILKKILQEPTNLDWRLALYLPQNVTEWSKDTLALVGDPDDIDSDDPDEDPQVIQDNNYRYVMGIQSVQEITANAKELKEYLSDDILFECFIYYFKSNAFMKL